MEKNNEPGSAKFGNFINYYTFNPPERRLTLIPKTLLSDFEIGTGNNCLRILDLGCNAGDLTLELFNHLHAGDKKVKSLGVDLDPVLIQRSKEKKQTSDVTFEVADLMSPTGRQWLKDYMSLQHIDRFDLVTCFSVTMWIHLNHGDSGLEDFLVYISGIARHLLIEPQPWKCYRTAVRRMKKLDCEAFHHYKDLTWRSSVAEDMKKYLTVTCQLRPRKEFGKTEQWEREICLFSAT